MSCGPCKSQELGAKKKKTRPQTHERGNVASAKTFSDRKKVKIDEREKKEGLSTQTHTLSYTHAQKG